MHYLTVTEKSRATTPSPVLVASCNIQSGNSGPILTDWQTHAYLLTSLPQTHTETNYKMKISFTLICTILKLYRYLFSKNTYITTLKHSATFNTMWCLKPHTI